MYIHFENRASVILYNFLADLPKNYTFLIPANVCPIVPAVYLKAGVSFEFVDINLETLEMDSMVILAKLKKNPNKYSGIHFVGTYGVNNFHEKLFREIKKISSKLLIIDDRCLQKPDFITTSTNSDLILYSTGYSKYIDINWGGYAFLSQNISYYKKHSLNYNPSKLDELTLQFNESIKNRTQLIYKDDDWLGDTKFNGKFSIYKQNIIDKIPNIDNNKKEINNIYRNEIPFNTQLSEPFQNWRFNILVRNKKLLLENIFANGLFASSHYSPVTFMFRQKFAPNAQKLFDHVINLFNDFRFSPEKAENVSKIVRAHVKQFGTVEFKHPISY
jgi:hypothetical protein